GSERDYLTVSKVAEEPLLYLSDQDFAKTISKLRRQMEEAAGKMDFEDAVIYRDRLLDLERRKIELGL
ncbi:MAG: UvrB/UvrC motif-containing protein, partial [Candidatus Hydrogenedentes bacterium]|nr:UvrB/UvrC motif-containing protein [Candidatus Hydrogenedentota bacterium]